MYFSAAIKKQINRFSTMRYAMLIILFLLSFPTISQSYYSGGGGSGFAAHGCVILKKYTPQTITSLAQLPDSARQNLQTFLSNYLSDSIFKKLKVVEGRRMNLDSMALLCPEIQNYQWKIPTYDLCLSFSDSAHQIGSYNFTFQVNGMGDIVDYQGHKQQTIPVTNFSQTGKVQFVSATVAQKTARKYIGRKKIQTAIHFYDGIIVWDIYRHKKSRRSGIYTHHAYINAHSGELYSIKKNMPVHHFRFNVPASQSK